MNKTIRHILTAALACASFLLPSFSANGQISLSPNTLTWEHGSTAPRTVTVTSARPWLRDSLIVSGHFQLSRLSGPSGSTVISVQPLDVNGSWRGDISTATDFYDDRGNYAVLTLTHSRIPASEYHVEADQTALEWQCWSTEQRSFTVVSSHPWTASVTGSMFSVSPLQGESGTVVTVTPAAGTNGDSSDRTGSININCGLASCRLSLTQAGDSRQNVVSTTTYTSPRGVSGYTDHAYYDGLGYLHQTVQAAASPQGNSIISPVEYDIMRRADARTYLPYVRTGSSPAPDADALASQAAFYSAMHSDTHPFADRAYGTSSLALPASGLREGDAWRQGAGHPVRYHYSTNTAEDAVAVYRWVSDGMIVRGAQTRTPGQLRKTTVTDEDGAVSISFEDVWGKHLLTRTFAGRNATGTVSDTYFVYDIRDSLMCVIQPEGAALLKQRCDSGQSGTLLLQDSALFTANADIVDSYCFWWKYDAWGNVLESHVPGGGTTVCTYDDRDRLVSEQTPRMRELGIERAMVYDECNRPVLEHYRRRGSNELISISHTWEYWPFATEDSFPSNEGACGGLLKHERIYDALAGDGAPEGYVDRYYHYDDRSRVIRVEEYDEDDNLSELTTTYDFVGNVTSTTQTQLQGGESHTLQTFYTYDNRGRLTLMSRTLDDCPLADVIYSYDELGRLLTKTAGWGTLSEAYSYDIHSWKTGSTALVNGETVFSQDLRYNAPLTEGHSGLYNGNISEGSVWYAGQDGSTENTAYTYDGLNRLTDAARPDNTERSILYDRNGNITGLTRYGEAGAEPEAIAFTHDGNRIWSVSSSAEEPGASSAERIHMLRLYLYDSAGNLTYDPRKQLEFSYNVCNLPSSVRRGGEQSSLITYRYLSDGTKVCAEAVLQPEIDEGDGITPARIYRRRYKGNFTYVTDPDTGEETLESIAWNEGMIFLRKMAEYAEPTAPEDTTSIDWVNPADTVATLDTLGMTIYDRWFVKDHLGNVRTVVELGSPAGQIVEQDDYLPFGTRFTPATQGVLCLMDTALYGSELDNRYRYAGKEEQRFGPQIDLALLDFGARAYDPFTARWTSVDPLAHKYLGFSPYNYCGGNPVMYFDPDGREIKFDKNSSREFKKRFKDAVVFMNKKGTSAKLAQLEKSSAVYYISDGRGKRSRNSFNPKTLTISWDPDSMFETDEGIYTSSTTILNHEIDHANEYDKNPEKVKKDNQPNSDEQFGTKEERRACENEQSTAERHGEVEKGQKVRNSHSGGRYISNCGASPEEQSKACREHNNMLL